jgi:hypothetical protein
MATSAPSPKYRHQKDPLVASPSGPGNRFAGPDLLARALRHSCTHGVSTHLRLTTHFHRRYSLDPTSSVMYTTLMSDLRVLRDPEASGSQPIRLRYVAPMRLRSPAGKGGIR